MHWSDGGRSLWRSQSQKCARSSVATDTPRPGKQAFPLPRYPSLIHPLPAFWMAFGLRSSAFILHPLRSCRNLELSALWPQVVRLVCEGKHGLACVSTLVLQMDKQTLPLIYLRVAVLSTDFKRNVKLIKLDSSSLYMTDCKYLEEIWYRRAISTEIKLRLRIGIGMCIGFGMIVHKFRTTTYSPEKIALYLLLFSSDIAPTMCTNTKVSDESRTTSACFWLGKLPTLVTSCTHPI